MTRQAPRMTIETEQSFTSAEATGDHTGRQNWQVMIGRQADWLLSACWQHVKRLGHLLAQAGKSWVVQQGMYYRGIKPPNTLAAAGRHSGCCGCFGGSYAPVYRHPCLAHLFTHLPLARRSLPCNLLVASLFQTRATNSPESVSMMTMMTLPTQTTALGRRRG